MSGRIFHWNEQLPAASAVPLTYRDPENEMGQRTSTPTSE
jgi:hypothetical protein